MKTLKPDKVKKLKVHTALQIARSQAEVYHAIIDPKQMSHYFISESSGPLEEGSSITWKFPEFDESFQIEVTQLIPHKLIQFEWPGDESQILQVEMKLDLINKDATLLQISEGDMKNDDQGLLWLSRNTAGWAHFLACLKAYLEFGINLRKGGFDFMKNTNDKKQTIKQCPIRKPSSS